MPFDRPTLSALRVQTASDIDAAMPGVDARLRYSNLGVMAEVLAGLANGQYGYADWIARQVVPFTATGEYLEGWAGLKGIVRKAAISASGQVTFTATDGLTLLAGTPVNRSDGRSYTIDADAVAAGGQVVAIMTASEGGAGGNCPAGVALSLGAGISGISATGLATGLISGGADIESDADLRSRMLAAYASPPQGGSITDYPRWALAVPGVTRAWVRPGAMGPGTVQVIFMMDEVRADQFGFPQGSNGVSTYENRDTAANGDQLAVANALFPVQPVTPIIYACAPTNNLITIELAGISGASEATRSAIAAAVRAALKINAVPGGVTNVSAIETAIASVPGAAGFVLVSMNASNGTIDHAGTGNITSDPGALPSLTQINYS